MIRRSSTFVLAFILSIQASLIVVGQYGQTDALMWYSPESDIEVIGSEVVSWHSLSDNSELIAPSAEYRPLVNSSQALINGFRTVSFMGSDILQTDINIAYPHSLVIVLKAEVNSQSYIYDTPSRLFQFVNSNNTAKAGSLAAHSSEISDGNFIILSQIISSTGTSSLYENGLSVVTGVETRTINGFLRFGASVNADRFLTGEFAEIIVYDTALNETEHSNIIDSLKSKYSPSPVLDSLYYLLPNCNLTISIPDRFQQTQWFKLEDESVELLSIDTFLTANEPGTYILEVLDVFNETYSDTIEVESLELSFLPSSICTGQPLIIDIPLLEDDYSILWSDPSLEGFNISLSVEGSYSFTISQLNDGCSYSSNPFQVSDIESIAEIYGVNNICEGNNLSINSFEGILIEWNTGSTGFSIEPEAEGEYFVEIINENGCIGRDTVNVIFQGVVPEVEILVDDVCFGSETQVSDLTAVEGAQILARTWSVNGELFSDSSFTYSPASSGQFPIEFIIELSNGCLGIGFDTLEVYSLPEVEFSFETACQGQVTMFSSTSAVIDGEVIAEEWNFGDESFDTGTNVSHSYEQEGAYEVDLIVESSFGCTNSSSQIVNVLSNGASECQNFSVDPTFWMYFDGNTGVNEDNEIIEIVEKANSITSQESDVTNRALLDSTIRINDYPAAIFDGENDFYDFSFDQPELPFSLFILLKPESSEDNFFIDTENRMFGRFQNTSFGSYNAVTYPIETPRDWFVSSLVVDGAQNCEVFANGEQVGIGINDRPLLNFFRIGGAWPNNRFFLGGIAEILIFNQALSEAERTEIETYIRKKYAPPVMLGKDKTIIPGCDLTLLVPDRFNSYQWKRKTENGTIVLLGNQSQQVISASGTYYLDAISLFNELSTDSLVVHPVNLPTEDFVCESGLVLIDLDIDDSSISINWSDPELLGSEVTISSVGEYILELTDSEGCIFEETYEFFDPEAYTEIIVGETFCLGNEIFFQNEENIALTYLWSTDEVSPFIQPQESGEYWVEATNANGCVGRDTVDIAIVGVAPDAELDFSPPCENNDVVFNDLTVPDGGSITEWDWIFENTDAGTSDDENPSIFYPSVGTYPVMLTVTLDNGCTGTTRDTVFVNPLPLVNFSAPLVCASNEVFFESLSAVPGGGTIALQEWSFGNGTFDTGAIGSTTFEVLGFNTVTHIVTTEDACVDSLLRNIEILGSPIVDFEVTDVCIGQTVVFEENVDVSVSGPVFYNWQFGDGFFSNFPNTSHEYAQAGIYQVTLTATGNNVGVNGCVDQETKEIRVYEPPIAEITTTDACVGATTDLVDVSLWRVIDGTTDPVIGRQWNILDGPTGSQEGYIGMDSVQTFIPEAAGTFDVGLELETAAGCLASTTGSFLVQAIPTADFDLALPEINPPFTSVPANLSEDGINFEWLINGELVSTEFEPTLTFDSAGDYEVLLVATNDLNCNDSAFANYTVIVPEYDIALIELHYQTQGNTLVLNAIISNNGNVVVENFDTDIQVGRDIQFTLESEIIIPPGDLIDYPLGSDIGYLPSRDLPYTCMRISNPNGQMETDTTNNYLCIGLNEQRATFGDPYPNPAKDEVKLTFVLPEDGPLNVEITGSDGRLIEAFVLDLKEGLNTVDYPLIGWAEGMYFLKFSYRNQEEVFRLVIAR